MAEAEGGQGWNLIHVRLEHLNVAVVLLRAAAQVRPTQGIANPTPASRQTQAALAIQPKLGCVEDSGRTTSVTHLGETRARTEDYV